MTTEAHRAPIGRKMHGVCGTPGCGERARWLPIPEANQLGSATLWRCEACTQAVPWTHAYADPSDGPWRVSCPDCHGGGVSGEFTREEANQRVIDHRAWHLADALEARRRGHYRCTECGMTSSTDDLEVVGRNCSASDFESAHRMFRA